LINKHREFGEAVGRKKGALDDELWWVACEKYFFFLAAFGCIANDTILRMIILFDIFGEMYWPVDKPHKMVATKSHNRIFQSKS